MLTYANMAPVSISSVKPMKRNLPNLLEVPPTKGTYPPPPRRWATWQQKGVGVRGVAYSCGWGLCCCQAGPVAGHPPGSSCVGSNSQPGGECFCNTLGGVLATAATWQAEVAATWVLLQEAGDSTAEVLRFWQRVICLLFWDSPFQTYAGRYSFHHLHWPQTADLHSGMCIRHVDSTPKTHMLGPLPNNWKTMPSVAFYSRRLTATEWCYSILDWKLLADFSVVKRFRFLLEGLRFRSSQSTNRWCPSSPVCHHLGWPASSASWHFCLSSCQTLGTHLAMPMWSQTHFLGLPHLTWSCQPPQLLSATCPSYQTPLCQPVVVMHAPVLHANVVSSRYRQ